MELTTFGAALKFALDQEAALAGFCAEAAAASEEPLRGILRELAASGDVNRRKLEQVRRQQVNEMLLEAIQGLDTEDYQFGLAAGDARVAVTQRGGETGVLLPRRGRAAQPAGGGAELCQAGGRARAGALQADSRLI